MPTWLRKYNICYGGAGSSTWFITTKQLLLGTNAHSVMATTKNLSCNSLWLVSIICIRSLSPKSVNEKLCSYPHLSNTGMIKWIKATKKLLHSTSNKKFWCEQGKWPLQQSDKNCTCMSQHEMARKYERTLRVLHQL